MDECNYNLICPECGSDEVYYENPTTGSGKYTCQDCEFMSDDVNDFKYAIPVKDYADLRAKLAETVDKNSKLQDDYETAVYNHNAAEADLRQARNAIHDLRAKLEYRLKTVHDQEGVIRSLRTKLHEEGKEKSKLISKLETAETEKVVVKMDAVRWVDISVAKTNIINQLTHERDEARRQVVEIAGCFKMSEENLQNAQRREAEAMHDKIQLQAQVVMLRGALEPFAKYDILTFNSECEQAREALSTTPAEAVKRVQGLVEAVKEIVRTSGNKINPTYGERLCCESLAKYQGDDKDANLS